MGECCTKELEVVGIVDVDPSSSSTRPGNHRTDFRTLIDGVGIEEKRDPRKPDAILKLNVGGRLFKTSRSYIVNSGSPVLLKVLADGPTSDGEYFLDRDGCHFRHVLNFLRDGADKFCMPQDEVVRCELHHEATSLGLSRLAQLLEGLNSVSLRSSMYFEEAENSEFMGAPIPRNEVERLHRLEELNILDTNRSEARYDNITRIIAALLRVPIALVSLVHDETQWFKSAFGLDVCSTDRKSSICAYTFTPEDPMEASMVTVEDCSKDPRTMRNELVSGDSHFRFYAGCPLVTSDGIRLGAFCVIDKVPGKITSAQAQMLVNFSVIVSQEIERVQLLNAAARGIDKIRGGSPPNAGDFSAGPLRKDRMRAALGEAVLLVNVQSDSILWPVLYANEEFSSVTSIRVTSPSTLPGEAIADGPGLECVSEDMSSCTNPTLWDWLQLSPDDAMQLVGRVRDEWSRGRPNVFNVNATMKVPKSPSGSSNEVVVSCRFMPADMPLDLNAAAIRPVPCRDTNDAFVFDNPPQGYLYFVSVSFDFSDACENQIFPLEKESATSESTENRQLRLLGLPQDPSLGKSLIKTAVDSVKPPVSPFFDVTLVRAVAEGSFGKVYFGLWCGSPVAVKVLMQYAEKNSKPSSRRKASQKDPDPTVEAALSVCISHPNLVQTFKHSTRLLGGVGATSEAASETWIVQEWCEGGTLGDYCKSCVLAPEMSEIIGICTDIANAGAYLHSRGIIHGDLSPSNVLLKGNVSSKRFVCKLCDFGRAMVLEGDIEEIKRGKIGTLTHMPPECLLKDCVFTKKVDVWSFGILLWQIFTRKKPYYGYTWAQVVHQVGEGKCPEFPAEEADLKHLYDHCTVKDPEARLSFQEISDCLHRQSQSLGDAEFGDMLRTYKSAPQVS